MNPTVASAVRSGLRDNRQASPHTPTRFISSNFSSPGSSFRQEEDAIILELNPRYLRAGFEGESSPQCVVEFSPENLRRFGDYRPWKYRGEPRYVEFTKWSTERELWRDDLTDFDLELMENKLERVIREVYNKHLLIDAGTARLILVIPSVLPHPLLSSMLATLFERWSYPSITLLPCPTMSAIAAGLRSALVLDVGWHETIVTSIYEYREVYMSRSVRGMKMLVQETGKALKYFCQDKEIGKHNDLKIDFTFVEELIHRLAFCDQGRGQNYEEADSHEGVATVQEDNKLQQNWNDSHDQNYFEVDWPIGSSSETVYLPCALFSNRVQAVFFPSMRQEDRADEHERPIQELIFGALRALPPDVRGLCMSRIVFTGEGSSIPGLAQNLLSEVEALQKQYAWSNIRGQKIKHQRNQLEELPQGRIDPPSARHNVPLPFEKDYIEAKLRDQQAKGTTNIETVTGALRQIDSLGPWAGASLLTSLKVKGFVEIERDRYMSQGLAGANREAEISVLPQRLSSFGVAASKSGDRNSWTLAGWG